MANRGNVSYTEVSDIVKDSSNSTDIIKKMCTAIKYNLQESIGYNNIKNNPKDYPNKKYRTVTSGYEDKLNAIANNTTLNSSMSASDITKMLGYEDIVLDNLGYTKMNKTVSKNDPISVSVINTAAKNLRTVSEFFNSINSTYWDSSNYCKLSCQVACQEACQLACQSCQYNTCHAQNCGGWS